MRTSKRSRMNKSESADTSKPTNEQAQTTTSEAPPQDSKDPENRLMLAILEEALVVYQRGLSSSIPERVRRSKETARWFASDDEDWPFSYLNICHTLSIDAEYIRSGIKKLAEEAARRSRKRVPGIIKLGKKK